MINCTCVVQVGQAPDENQGNLESALTSFTGRVFGEEARITWVPVDPGNGFTAGQPSTSSVISITATESLSPERREALLRELVSLWTEQTGCTVDEVVAVIADPAPN
jgi:hypothetical protein